MAGPGSAQDIAAQDDEHLRSLGIKPELQRSLGFLSNFAVASYYLAVQRGQADRVEADAATGEAVIG